MLKTKKGRMLGGIAKAARKSGGGVRRRSAGGSLDKAAVKIPIKSGGGQRRISKG
jgi:hypothetical protein